MSLKKNQPPVISVEIVERKPQTSETTPKTTKTTIAEKAPETARDVEVAHADELVQAATAVVLEKTVEQVERNEVTEDTPVALTDKQRARLEAEAQNGHQELAEVAFTEPVEQSPTTVDLAQLEQEFIIRPADALAAAAPLQDEQQPQLVKQAETAIVNTTDAELINRQFAEIVRADYGVDVPVGEAIAEQVPAPALEPDFEAMFAQFGDGLEADGATLDTEGELDGEGANEFVDDLSPAEDLLSDDEVMVNTIEDLSEEDLALLATWAEFIAGAEPDDFAISEEDALSFGADYRAILEQLDWDAETGEVADDVEVEMAVEAAVEHATDAFEAAPTPILAVAVEQITEHIAMLEPEAIAETHALLAEVSRELQVVEKLLARTSDETVSDRLDTHTMQDTEITATLVQSIQKLCEHIGLDYSEEQISQLVQQLIDQQVGVINLNGQSTTGSAEINQIDLNMGTHEALSWFLSSIKQLKKQTNRMHASYIGQQLLKALSSFNSTQQTVAQTV